MENKTLAREIARHWQNKSRRDAERGGNGKVEMEGNETLNCGCG